MYSAFKTMLDAKNVKKK